MQYNQPRDSDEDTHSSPTYTQNWYTSSAKRAKATAEFLDKTEEELDYHSDNSQKKYDRAKTRQGESFNRLAENPWILSASTVRLHRIEELTLEIEDSESRTQALTRKLQEENQNRQRLLFQVKDLTDTQLQEQLTETLEKATELYNEDCYRSHTKKRSRCQDKNNKALSHQDSVLVDNPFNPEESVTGRVLQTSTENNTILVRLCQSGKVYGCLGSSVEIVEEHH